MGEAPVEFNARTCITAGQLRAGGLPIPNSIPDCGWIPKRSIQFLQPDVTVDDLVAGKINIAIAAKFLEPFRWVKLDFPPEVIERIQEEANKKGMSLQAFVDSLLEEE